MKKLLLIAVTPLILGACASGALKVGPDTYQVSASRHNLLGGGAPAAQAAALEQANAQCDAIGKDILVKNSSTGFARPLYTHAVTFQCLAKTDRELVRPVYRSAPSAVIEVR